MSGNNVSDNGQGKSCCDMATELYKTMGKDWCVGLVIHLMMYVSGSYSEEENRDARKKEK